MSRPLPVPYTAAEAAQILRVSPFEVARLCRAGRIKADRPGRSWLIDPEDLEAFKKGKRTDEDAA